MPRVSEWRVLRRSAFVIRSAKVGEAVIKTPAARSASTAFSEASRCGDLRAKDPQPQRVAQLQLVQPDERQRQRLAAHLRHCPARVGVGCVEGAEEAAIGVGAHVSPRDSEIKSVAVLGSTLGP